MTAPDSQLASRVYAYGSAPTERTAGTDVPHLCRGGGLDLKELEVTATTLAAGHTASEVGADQCERILIITQGSLDIAVGERAGY